MLSCRVALCGVVLRILFRVACVHVALFQFSDSLLRFFLWWSILLRSLAIWFPFWFTLTYLKFYLVVSVKCTFFQTTACPVSFNISFQCAKSTASMPPRCSLPQFSFFTWFCVAGAVCTSYRIASCPVSGLPGHYWHCAVRFGWTPTLVSMMQVQSNQCSIYHLVNDCCIWQNFEDPEHANV